MASASEVDKSEIRVVLIGRTGEGKSTTGNNLLSKQAFKTSSFAKSITRKCQRGSVNFNGRSHLIVDTPGLFDTEIPEEENINEIVRCISLSSPGPHAIILVTSVGRFTHQDRDVFKKFSDIFGERLFEYLIVVFTKMDNLKRDGNTLQEFIDTLSHEEKEFLKSCDDRYIGIDNRANNYEDATSLMKMISKLVMKNNKSYYSQAIYDEAEAVLNRKMDELKGSLKPEETSSDILREKVRDECEEDIGFFGNLWFKIKTIFKSLFRK